MHTERADGEKHRERREEWRGNEKDAHTDDEKRSGEEMRKTHTQTTRRGRMKQCRLPRAIRPAAAH
jgi:hypothetical protein